MACWFSLSGIGAGAVWCLCGVAGVAIGSFSGVVYCGPGLGLGGSFSWAGGSARAPRVPGFILLVGGSRGGCGSLLAWDGLSGLWRACGLCPESRVRRVCASLSEVYLTGKLLWHFACGFNFVHSLLLPFEAALAVLKRLNGKKNN